MACRRLLALGSLLLAACAGGAEPVRLEDLMRVGVDPVEEAEAVEANLVDAGWERTRRVEHERFVALSFRRGAERAVRVISARGAVVSLDSHEPDGVRERHGPVALAPGAPRDVDGDGEDDLIVVRETEPPCLAVLTFDEDGRAELIEDDADALRDGACVAALEDVDGDGIAEAIVALRWPDLSEGEPPAEVRVAMTLDEGRYRAETMPVSYVEAERARRAEALAAAHARGDAARGITLAVEVAALAHLTGASLAAQVERFDEALSGLVLTEAQRDRVHAIRAVIASGWRDPEP